MDDRKNWHKSVYQKRDGEITSLPDDWPEIRKVVLKRDGYSCMRCEKKNAQGRGLTIHHIIPRSDGGSNDANNLITLCNPCHDLVEIEGLRTLAAIQGSYEDVNIDRAIESEKTANITDEGYHFIRPAWHKWVYGGQKRGA